MTAPPPRVAYFPDSFHEVNGVAHTSRHFEAFARGRDLPFLCVRAGDREPAFIEDGNVWTLELPRGAFSFALEKDLRFDPGFLRHVPIVDEVVERFRPDVVHITGPSELGMLGAGLAWNFNLPMAASWHTNVHEYAARRSDWLLRLLPPEPADAARRTIEDITMSAIAAFYEQAGVLFAPNPDLCRQLEYLTGRPCLLMPRGVDADAFHPACRNRLPGDRDQVLGFVGRLSVEKNVALLARIHRELEELGHRSFHFLIVGQGGEEARLRESLPRAVFTGCCAEQNCRQPTPSHTDTFGNVVLEAMASGVPCIVTPDGGPKTIVRDGETGRVVPDEEFAAAVSGLLRDPVLHGEMRKAARAYAETASWHSVFEGVFKGYERITSKAKLGGE